MPDLNVNGRNFNYMDQGAGEAILHILGLEWGYEDSWEGPRPTGIPRLAKADPLASQYRVIAYNTYPKKIVVPGEGPTAMPVTHPAVRERVAEASADCLALMDRLNVQRAHIFTHSQVSFVGLDLALRAPESVHTLSMHDPELINPSWLGKAFMNPMERRMDSPQFQAKQEELKAKYADDPSNLQRSQQGGHQQPDDVSEGHARIIETVAANSYDEPAEFQSNFYAKTMLGTSMEEASRSIKQPLLSILTPNSASNAKLSDAVLRARFPQTETYVVPKPAHWYSGSESMKDLGNGLVNFLNRHPISNAR